MLPYYGPQFKRTYVPSYYPFEKRFLSITYSSMISPTGVPAKSLANMSCHFILTSYSSPLGRWWTPLFSTPTFSFIHTGVY